MLSYIKKYSLAIIVSFALLGCVDSNKSTKNSDTFERNSNAVTIESLKSFGTKIETKNLRAPIETLKTQTSMQPNGMQDSKICQNDGTMDFNIQESKNQFSFDANNCTIDQTTINGAITINSNQQNQNILIEVIKELTIDDPSSSILIKKGSKLSITLETTTHSFTIDTSFHSIIDNEVLAVNNLVIKGTNKDDIVNLIYLESGEMLLGNNYLKVDPSYDHSQTPFTIDQNGYLQSGLMKLLDGASHKIEIAVKSENELEIKVDENGDGNFSDNEILIEYLY